MNVDPPGEPGRVRTRGVELGVVVLLVLTGVVGWSGTVLGQGRQCDVPITGAGTVQSGGAVRTYRLHAPPNSVEHEVPVIIGLHGRGSTAEELERKSNLSQVGAVAVYPQALPGKDGRSAWAGAPYSSSADDVAFIGDLIDDLEERLCVDADRIHVVGLSNGGGLAAMLGCRLADRLAGYATVSGAFYPEAGLCIPAEPLPVVNLHGTGDRVVPYEGNPAKGQPPVQEWLRQRAAINDCATEEQLPPRPNLETQRWVACEADATVTHHRIIGGDHDWPDNVDTAGLVWAALNPPGQRS